MAPTIQVVEHRTATEFLRAAESVLGRAEVEHALLLGIAIASAAAEPTHVDERTRWLTARRDEETLAAAMWSAPFRPVLSNGPIDVATVFARWFLATAPDLAGVSGPAEHCLAFMRAWRAGGGPGMRRMIRMGIHELNEVDWLAVGKTPASGQLRRANAGDVGTIIAWTRAFYEEVQLGGDPPPDESSIAQKVTSGRIFVWDHGGPVSMAGAARPTRRGVTVNLVYTPSQHRGKGHATACVAHLSAQLLERHAFCTLFTDLANPTSNAIYKRIGYRPVADFDVWLR